MDKVNGRLTFGTFNNLSGIYQLGTFNKELTTGTLKILSSLYLGCSIYRVVVQVTITNYFLFEDGNNVLFEDGNKFIFEN